MNNNKPFCITFAGPLGCSKSPVAHYLSCELGLPIYSNDAVRNEIKEDLLARHADAKELDLRAAPRIEAMIARKQNFIADISQDRRWERFLSHFLKVGADYKIGVVSFDLSPTFYRQLIAAKEYGLSDDSIKSYLADHARTAAPKNSIICRITDENFQDRLNLSLAAVRQFAGDNLAK